MQVGRGKSAAALRERWQLPWQPVRFWRVGGVLTRTGGEGLPGVKSIRRTEMIERSAGVKHCRFCGAGLTGEAAYCSGCGRETVLRAVAHPMAQGEMRVAQEGWRYAPLWRRFLARALDVVLVLAAYYGFTFMLGAATGLVVGEVGESELDSLTTTLVIVGLTTVLAGYIIYLWIGTASGGTLSQRLVGLRVLNKDTLESPGAGRALVRVLMSVLLMLLSPLIWCLGYLWALWDTEKQTWHDKAAGTIVVSGVTLAPRQAAVSPAQYA